MPGNIIDIGVLVIHKLLLTNDAKLERTDCMRRGQARGNAQSRGLSDDVCHGKSFIEIRVITTCYTRPDFAVAVPTKVA